MDPNDNSGITSICEANNGNYIVGAMYYKTTMVGNYTFTSTGNNSYDGIIIEYNSGGEVEWAETIGGSNNDYLTSISATSDGGILSKGLQNYSCQ